jgi:hypothetical protein
MPLLVGGLRAPRGERDELIAHVDEGHPGSGAPAQLKVERTPVPRERVLDVADLERYVVDAEQASHAAPNLRYARGRTSVSDSTARGWQAGVLDLQRCAQSVQLAPADLRDRGEEVHDPLQVLDAELLGERGMPVAGQRTPDARGRVAERRGHFN